ncbi:ORF6N domain-containing protein [bacterium]|nr:ORF6N domain-containing protein [bacterium]
MIKSSISRNSMPDIFLYKGQMVIPDYELASYYGVNTDTLRDVFAKHESLFPGSMVFSVKGSEKKKKSTTNKASGTLLFTEQSATLIAGLIKDTEALKANMRLLRLFRLLDYIVAT